MDKYDLQIANILGAADVNLSIQHAWGRGRGLFQFARVAGRGVDSRDGCLTMIRQGPAEVVGRPKLTAEIREDIRLPQRSGDIRVEHLPIFAQWQRRLDKEIRKVGGQ